MHFGGLIFNSLGMFSRSWIINGRGLSRKVKNVSAPASCQIKDSDAKLECPCCHQTIHNSDLSEDWPGLPVGVKFDPSDLELLEHLAAKCGVGNLKPHSFIDEFIPTLEGHQGICYTHPENLPCSKKDGSIIHFFYRTFNAYATGRRKRRKIQDGEGLIKKSVCWHKTGKTKTLLVNGVQKGYKKIMVLYSSSKNGGKAAKCSWVMHQYHLGAGEDEKQGEYVVCKIFYQQPKHTENNETSVLAEESDAGPTRSPKTPQPFRADNTPLCDDIVTGHVNGSTKENVRPITDDLPEDLASIVTSCWREDPNARPKFTQIIQMLLHYLTKISPPEPAIPLRIRTSKNSILPPESPGTSSLMAKRVDPGETPKTPMESKPRSPFSCFHQCF